ncbi:trehalose-6-phosphate synthase [Candidatus Daviesbacteria bacterium]|nr:trehalose-6-phosphate synthase [Candidatus Daviesbacteria bacterium]
MKQLLIAVFLIVVIITLIVVAFTASQALNEEQRLESDLQYRSKLLADSLKETVEPQFINKSQYQLQYLVSKFEDKERLVGLNIYDNKAIPVATSSSLTSEIPKAKQIAADAMDQDQATGDFINLNNKKIYLLAAPLHDKDSVVGALMIAQNAGYIDTRIAEIWKNNLVRLFVQASLLSLATLVLIRWLIYAPIKNLVESLKFARSGGEESNSKKPTNSLFFRPLVNEITNIRRSLQEARSSASEEAKLRLEKLDSPWTSLRLKEFIKDILKGRTVYMVSNREPYIHIKNGGKISFYTPASGMVTAIEPVMQACEGTWIAYGSGNGDKLMVNRKNQVKVPPDEPKYTLKRVWLTEEEEKGYYDGFSNEGLWPLCHIAHNRPIFRKEDWDQYQIANQKFADAVISEIKNQERPIVLIQDFHLALLPRMIKAQKPSAVIGLFWHIPWPNAESFSICPWKKEILDGMLGADLLGFHTQLHCNNFIETVGREIESLIDLEQSTISKGNHTSYIKSFPISIAFPNGYHGLKNYDYSAEGKKLLNNLKIRSQFIGVGVDRLDYTKGILERFKAIEIFLDKYPLYKGKFTFIQVAAPSRTKVKKYKEFAEEVRKEAERVNSSFKENGWKPIVLLERHHSHEEVQTIYKLADLCLVTSLHDGMNLVAKEYVAARDDEKGVLILSQYTGASRELKDAIIVNPYNAEQTANAIREALEMTPKEQTKRIRDMREIIKNNNVYRWSAQLLKTMAGLG